MLYPLVGCLREGTDEILDVLGRFSSARELTVAVQEVAEYLINTDEDNSGDEHGDSRASAATQFIRLLNIYTHGMVWDDLCRRSSQTFTAIPRLKTKKPPSHTLAMSVGDIQQTIIPATLHATSSEGRSVVSATARLVQDLHTWAGESSQGDQAELTRCKVRI